MARSARLSRDGSGTGAPAGRRPCARAAPASGTRPSPARPRTEARRLGGLRRRREGTVGGAFDLEEIKHGRGAGAGLGSWRWLDTSSSWRTRSRAARTLALLGVRGGPGQGDQRSWRRACGRWRTGVWRETPDARIVSAACGDVATSLTGRQRLAALLAAEPR